MKRVTAATPALRRRRSGLVISREPLSRDCSGGRCSARYSFRDSGRAKGFTGGGGGREQLTWDGTVPALRGPATTVTCELGNSDFCHPAARTACCVSTLALGRQRSPFPASGMAVVAVVRK